MTWRLITQLLDYQTDLVDQDKHQLDNVLPFELIEHHLKLRPDVLLVSKWMELLGPRAARISEWILFREFGRAYDTAVGYLLSQMANSAKGAFIEWAKTAAILSTMATIFGKTNGRGNCCSVHSGIRPILWPSPSLGYSSEA